MEIGKVPESVLKRSVFKNLTVKREEVLIHSGIGEDCSAVHFAEDEVMVLSTDPITGSSSEIGTLAFHITANDIASSGAELVGMMVTILLPEEATEETLREIMKDLSAACKKYNVEIIGGHTEVSDVVKRPIVSVVGVGKAKKDTLVSTAGLEPGDDIVVTKYIGIEGTSILAWDKEEVLLERLGAGFVEEAKEFGKMLSVVPDSKVAMQVGVTAMHDITEGGVFGALWEMASASKVGLEVDLKKIPIRQETIEVCEVFDVNPYMLISSGSMLIGTKKGAQLVEALAKEGIHAAVVGRATNDNDRVIINGEERRFLEPPKVDELYKALA